jgi:GNAT superfamily N-acetyltransferase
VTAVSTPGGGDDAEGVLIRRLVPDEWAVYRDVRLAALSDAPEAFGSTLAREQAFAETEWRGRLGRHPQFVAFRGDAVVGTIGVIGLRERHKIADIVSMWVVTHERGRGVGDRLVRVAIETARAAGCVEVSLWVADGNGYAERLYARHGFVRTGAVLPIRDDEPDRLEFQMALMLSNRAPS